MARRSPIVRTFKKNVIPPKPPPVRSDFMKPPLKPLIRLENYAVCPHCSKDVPLGPATIKSETGSKLSMLQDICVKLVVSGRHVTMSTQHVDDHLLDDLRHELIRQGVMVKRAQ